MSLVEVSSSLYDLCDKWSVRVAEVVGGCLGEEVSDLWYRKRS